MIPQDKQCACRDCKNEFTFTAQQQAEFKTKGFSDPTRCPECHQKRDARRRYGRGGDTQIHVAPCSACGKEARLPFMPTETRPVYCAECFVAKSAKPAEGSAVGKPGKSAHAADEAPGAASFAKFALDSRIERAVRKAGYDTPTPVQAATIPIALSGRDLIGTAQTGTGKTAAFVLPILQHLLANPVEKPRTRVIVLTPTRELAEQVNDVFRELGKFSKIRSVAVYGGVAMDPQENALRTGAEVIVACPGRLLDHIERGNTNFAGVEKLVLDEADRMLDMGFLPSIKRILSHLPAERHSMLFSATFADELMDLTRKHLTDPQRVDVDLCVPPTAIAHALYPCPQHLKTSLVLKLLSETDTNSVLIFTRTKDRANRVMRQVVGAGYAASVIHSNKSQNQRQLALDDFRAGKCRILVATDIAARGLDVETISHVINYDIPDTADTYIHRIGRTGRMAREGDAMTLVTAKDGPIVFEIEKALGGPIERRRFEDFDYTAPPPSKNEFRRESPRRSQPRATASTTNPRARSGGPAKAKAQKTPGYFASQRVSRAKASGIIT